MKIILFRPTLIAAGMFVHTISLVCLFASIVVPPVSAGPLPFDKARFRELDAVPPSCDNPSISLEDAPQCDPKGTTSTPSLSGITPSATHASSYVDGGTDDTSQTTHTLAQTSGASHPLPLGGSIGVTLLLSGALSSGWLVF